MSWGPNAWFRRCLKEGCEELVMVRFIELATAEDARLLNYCEDHKQTLTATKECANNECKKETDLDTGYCEECEDLVDLGQEVLDGTTKLWVEEDEST